VHALPWVIGVAYVVDGLVSLALLGQLSDFRTDIPKGASPFSGRKGTLSPLYPSNYRAEGMRLWRWFIATQVLAQLLLLGWLFSST
jgi:hypothetical protein